MLIPCDRHKAVDLRGWAELEWADKVWANQGDRLARLAARSLDAIEAFIAGPCYASTSWGKDSVVLLHLFLSVRGQVVYHEEAVDYARVDPRLPTIVWDRETYRLWDAAWRKVEEDFGARHFSGIRSEESSGRRLRMRRFGLNSPNASAPLGWWTQADIFAYLAAHQLPVHPNYAMLGGGRWKRDHLRVSEIGDEKGIEFGRREWEKEYYGDLLRRNEASSPLR